MKYYVQKHRKAEVRFTDPVDAFAKRDKLHERLLHYSRSLHFWYTFPNAARPARFLAGHVVLRDNDYALAELLASIVAEAEIAATISETVDFEVIDPEGMI